ncbi:MAG: FRG domain-containing protein [Planctomycetota bacterium]|jgi:hypothetical protein
MKALRVNNVNDLMNAVYATMKRFDGQHLWWRGQARNVWDVIPPLYQNGYGSNEHNLALIFQNKAKVRHSRCPDPADRRSWLLLMHHYGLPTRLLNWSESVLVAAYFAVSEKKFMEETGSLWGLEPTKLNASQSERKGILVHQDEEVSQMFHDAFENVESNGEGRIFAIMTEQMDVRQMVQFSTYTIHGTNVPINQMPGMEKYLVQYEIPASAKPQLLQALELLGIKKSFLFPDLKHLADDLQTIEFD